MTNLFLYIYIKFMISKHILLITFLNEPELMFFLTQLNGFTDSYLIRIILFSIKHLFVINWMFLSIAMYPKIYGHVT